MPQRRKEKKVNIDKLIIEGKEYYFHIIVWEDIVVLPTYLKKIKNTYIPLPVTQMMAILAIGT